MRRLATLGGLAVALASGPAFAAVCQDPRLLVLFDSSGSLGLKSNAASNYNAAVNAVEQVVAAEGAHIEFGMLVFPSAPDARNCQVSATMAVPFALSNSAAFNAFFDGFAGPHSYSDTPMLQVIKRVSDAAPDKTGIGAVKAAGIPGHVLLVTDGSQDCCFDEYYGTGFGWDGVADCNWGNPYGSANYWNTPEFEQNRAELVGLVGALRNQGLTVWVVGFGTKVDPQALNDMAVAGGTPRVAGCGVGAAAGACYYQAGSPAELSAALASIAKQVGEESCNDLDDDCDGRTDEDVTRACATVCGTGVETCADGLWGTCSARAAGPEECNDLDDDCDGATDEDLDQLCWTECGTGLEFCEAGEWVGCTADPVPEECNDWDDDCDGSVDEGCECVDGAEEACGPGDGACEPGWRQCVGGVWGDCLGGVGPKAETCNDADDDCDGKADGIERPCHTTCGTGKETCTGGAWGACTAPQPGFETCNGQDDDCDGTIDWFTRECTTACGTGQEQCVGGSWGRCTAPAPQAETCNRVDDDCDGQTDEAAETAIPCTSDCGRGVRACADGEMGPCVISEPEAEACDGLDNDCDGVADDEAPCADGGQCVCGGCAAPAGDDGVCEDGVLQDGFCVVDHCPPGKTCHDGACVEAGYDVELVGVPEQDLSFRGGGCGCRQAGGSIPAVPFEALLLLGGLAGIALASRRVRRVS